MKPSDLKTTFDAKRDGPFIKDRIFFVPLHEQETLFSFPSWNDPLVFANRNPVCIEFCSGNGAWIAEKAKEFPEKNWIAVERQFDRVRKIWAKIKNNNLSNLFVVWGECLTFCHFYVPEHTVEEAYINFPDPWPKRRHQKHRLMNTSFLNELSRILKPQKNVTFVTDDSSYLLQTITLFNQHPKFRTVFEEPHFVNELKDYGTSWFEDFWRQRGKSIYYTQFITHEN